METKTNASKFPIKYEYESEEEYLLNHYIEKLTFAKYKMEQQMKSATARQKEQEFECKLFGGIWAANIILLPIGVLMCISGWVLTLLGGVFLVIVCIGGLWTIMPACIYKFCKAFIVLSINKQNAVGRWAVQKFSLTIYKSEILQCNEYLQRYTVILEDFNEWKEALSLGEPVDVSAISKRVEGINFDPEIKVTNPNSGELKRFSMIVSIVLSVLIIGLLLWAGAEVYMKIYHDFLYMFEQV